MFTDERLPPIEIGFGDELATPTEKRVIIDVGTGPTCCTAGVIDMDGREALSLGGGTNRKNLGEKTGKRWSLSRIEQAMMVFHSDTEPVGPLYAALQTSAKKKPRMLYIRIDEV